MSSARKRQTAQKLQHRIEHLEQQLMLERFHHNTLRLLMEEVARRLEQQEPVAVRHSFDGHGYIFIDNGSGSDWLERGLKYPDAEVLVVKEKV